MRSYWLILGILLVILQTIVTNITSIAHSIPILDSMPSDPRHFIESIRSRGCTRRVSHPRPTTDIEVTVVAFLENGIVPISSGFV